MIQWKIGDLEAIALSENIMIGHEQADGRTHRWITIWVVRVGDDLYVRSADGLAEGWFHTMKGVPIHIMADGVDRLVDLDPQADPDVRSAVDAAYRTKYGSSPFLNMLLSDSAQDGTLLMSPTDG